MNIDLYTINFFPVIGSLFLLFFLWKNSFVEKKIRLIFYILIAVSAVELVTYDFELLLPYTHCNRLILTLVTCIGYTLRPLMLYLFIMLIIRDDHDKNVKLFLNVPLIINLVFSISGFFTDLTYSYNDDLVFQRGPLGWSPHIVMLFYLLSMIVLSLTGKRKRTKFEQTLLYEISIILTLGAFSESLFSSFAILRIAITSSLLFYYMFFQSQIYKDDMTQKQLQQAKMFEHFSYQVVAALAGTVDAKDSYTNGHSQRVADYSKEIASRLGKSESFIRDIYFMGLLHDIGKIGIPDSIINKKGKLTEEEYTAIKMHPVIGSEVLKKIPEMPELYRGAKWHHERYDGHGYPDGIAGENIPIEARIIAVADAYDAMSSKRSYRDAMPQAEIRAELVRVKGAQLDPVIADIMIGMIDEDHEYNMKEN